MAEKNLDGSGLNEVWVRAAQLVKKYTGAVDLTKGNLQTQVDTKITGTDDTKDNVITFTSSDELNPSAWKDVTTLESKEKHLSLFNKISTMFSNVRYLYKILGSTDISALGSVTQAIATLNGNVGNMKGISSSSAITVQGQYALDAREKNASVEGTLANELSKVNSNLLNVFQKNGYWLCDSDANNINQTGIGMTTNNFANVPDDGWGTLVCFGISENYALQIIHTWNYNKIYIRACYAKSWTDWNQIG